MTPLPITLCGPIPHTLAPGLLGSLQLSRGPLEGNDVCTEWDKAPYSNICLSLQMIPHNNEMKNRKSKNNCYDQGHESVMKKYTFD